MVAIGGARGAIGVSLSVPLARSRAPMARSMVARNSFGVCLGPCATQTRQASPRDALAETGRRGPTRVQMHQCGGGTSRGRVGSSLRKIACGGAREALFVQRVLRIHRSLFAPRRRSVRDSALRRLSASTVLWGKILRVVQVSECPLLLCCWGFYMSASDCTTVWYPNQDSGVKRCHCR